MTRRLSIVGDFGSPAVTTVDLPPKGTATRLGQAMRAMGVSFDCAWTSSLGEVRSSNVRARALSDLSADALPHFQSQKTKLEARSALVAARGPLACERNVRERLCEAMSTEAKRLSMRDKLGLSPGTPCGATTVFEETESAADLRARLSKLKHAEQGRQSSKPWIEELLALTHHYPTSEGYDLGWRAVSAVVVQCLHPDWLRIKPEKPAIDAMIAALDDQLSRDVLALLHTPRFRQVEDAWRTTKVLAELEAHISLVSCEPSQLGSSAVRSILQAHAAEGAAIAVMHPVDWMAAGPPFETLAEALPSDANVVLQAEEHLAARMVRDSAFARRAAHQLMSEGWRRLGSPVRVCLSRYLVRLPYGGHANPVRIFHFEELGEPPNPELLRYAPASPLVAAYFLGADAASIQFEAPCLHHDELEEGVVTSPTVLPAAVTVEGWPSLAREAKLMLLTGFEELSLHAG
ncbi:MAG: hypothetical protein U0271_32175 [Polyangiaceae bacterium]